MMRRLRHLSSDSRASVAVEMALVVPLLITLMFGGLEGAYYLWNEHIAIKAVRDGARFASRQPFTKYDCGADIPTEHGHRNRQHHAHRNPLAQPAPRQSKCRAGPAQ